MEQNIFASPPAAAEVYVCFLNPENQINKIIIFGKNAGAAAAAAGAEFNMSNFRFPASKMPLVDIVYSGQRIHKDDTISLIKNKIIRAARGGVAAAPEEFLYEELYMFNEVPRRANWAKLYMDLAARGGGEAPGEDILRKLKENIPTLDIDPAVATYEDFVNLPETQYVRTPIGVKFVGGGGAAADLLFPANPYAAAATATAAEKPPNTYIFENELLLNYLGSGAAAAAAPIIYVCLAPAAAEVLPPHYTLLSRAAGGTPIEQWKKTTLLQRREIDNTPIKDAVDIFYDIAATAATQQPTPEVLPDFIDSGITSFFIKIHPATTYTLPLETIFKILHTSETYPLIKFNPGTGRENLYRLHTDKVAQNGRKIPVLPRSEINNITRKVGKSRQIAIYVLAAGGATELYCTFDVNGDLSIQSGVFDRPLAMIEVDELIKTYIQPIINNVNENLSAAGYNIPNFVSLRDQNNSIEIINIDYVWYIPDKSQTATLNKQIEKFRPAFFSLFERIEFMKNIKNGLQLKYKRVGNYKPMEAQKALIADLFKKYGNVVQVLEELTTIYHLTKEDAAIAVAKYRDTINAVYDEKGKVRGALENPGFSTNIRFIQRNVKNIIVGFEMSGITSFHYIDVLQIYVRSFFMLFFYPKSIPEKIYKSLERTWGASKLEGAAVAAAAAAVPVAAAENMVIFEPAAAAAKPPVPEEEDADEEAGDEEAALQPPPVEDYDSEEMDDLLGLLGDESSDDDDDDDPTTAPPSTSGGAPAEPDIEKQKQLLENKSLHPNPFSKRREELDKVLFRVPADKKNKTFTSYSRACPANIYRQPVALTDEEKAHIDENYPGSYTKALKYGSDKEHMNWYICPRYWCLLTNTSMTYADIMAGKCGNSTKIIPKGEKKIPKDTFIYEFNDFGKEHLDKNGNYIDHFPGLTKQINETYKRYPCCFKTLDEDAAAEDEAAAAAAAAPTAAPEPAAAAIGYVLGSEKSPVPEGKWGYLPVVVQFFLQTNNSLCARVENPNTLKQNTPCILRYGVESACFLACLAEIYGYKNKTKTPAVEEMRRILAEKISGAQFAAAHGGELARIFGGVEENFRDFIKNSGIYEIDYRYLWDIICSPGFLFEDGLNLVILNVPNNDITGNVEIICPTNSYSSVPLYDAQKETAIMIKSGKLYEPIYLYENRKDSVIIKKTFHPSTSTPALKKVLDTIAYSTNRFCSPYPVIDFVRPIHIDEIVRRAPGWRINKHILNNQGNVIALEVVATTGAEPRRSGIIPCAPFQKPAAGAAVISVNKVKWADYETTITFLRTFSRETGLPFTPIVKILEDGLITGVLTETNQFISIDAPTENNRGGDDGLKAINTSNLILTESDFYNSAAPDEERIKTTKLISLESQFYQTFRSLARSIINKNLAERKHIAAILAEKITYREKLTRIQRELRDLMEGSVDFVKFTDKVLMSIDRVVSCGAAARNCDEKYCLKTAAAAAAGGAATCKLLIPRNHLLHNSPNDVIYYARLADEIIRYKKIQTFIFNQNTFLNLSNIKYNILDNEIILLENNIKSGDYFENLVPEKYKITYSRATPAGAEITPFVFTLEDQERRRGQGAAVAAAAAATAAAPPPAADLYKNIQNCIKETTERIKGNINSKWYRILPTRCGEVFFTNTAGICSFAPIIYIYQTIFNVYVSPNDIKQKLVEAYEAAADESAAMAAGIYNLMYKEGKRELSTKLRSGELTFERAIMSEDYYLTNIDLWMFFSSVKFPASIVLFTALKLKQIDEIMGEEIDWLLLNGAAAAGATPEKFFFIRSPTKYEINEPAQYSIVSPAIKLTETRGDFQDEFRGAAVEKTQIGDFLRAAAAAEPARRGRKRIIVMGK